MVGEAISLSSGRLFFFGMDMVFSDFVAESTACFAGDTGGVARSIFAASSSFAADAFRFLGEPLPFCCFFLCLRSYSRTW